MTRLVFLSYVSRRYIRWTEQHYVDLMSIYTIYDLLTETIPGVFRACNVSPSLMIFWIACHWRRISFLSCMTWALTSWPRNNDTGYAFYIYRRATPNLNSCNADELHLQTDWQRQVLFTLWTWPLTFLLLHTRYWNVVGYFFTNFMIVSYEISCLPLC